jgi:hypothetical protein
MKSLEAYEMLNPVPTKREGESDLSFNKRWDAWAGARNQAWANSADALNANAAREAYREQCRIRMSIAFKPEAGVIYDDERMHKDIRKMTGNSKWLHPLYEQQN